MINTRSSFYYDYTVTAEPFNGNINIDEGSGEVTIVLPVGSYTLTSLAIEIRNALNTQGTLDYTVGTDRVNRTFTIAASANFSLLTNSGSTPGTAAWSLLGFDTAADLTGVATYTSSISTGQCYTPQFLLQSYVDDEDFQQANLATKNIAADGKTVETISFGTARFVKMDFKFITNRSDVADCINIRHNPTGLEDARAFLKYITRIRVFEFNLDANNPATFKTMIVESMPEFADGTGYRLRELINDNITDVYETGVMTMRVVD